MLSLILSGESTGTGGGNGWVMYVMLGLLVVALIVMFWVSSRRNKKRQKEAEDLINAVKPGNKVKTIGGVCGIVVEVDDEENTFVLETGSEASGKCYIKFDRQAIYQTDAVVEKETKTDEKAKDDSATDTAESAPEETVSAEETAPAAEETETAEESKESK